MYTIKIMKTKNFIIISFILAVFFFLNLFHNWTNNLPIKLHFCNHTFCMIFSIIFFGFAYFANKNKKSYLKSAIIILIIGVVLMNITTCINGGISLNKELFTTYPEVEDCSDICVGWDYGFLSKVPNMCLEDGDLLVTDTEMLISKSLYISPCCCYNADTCEDLGYISRTPEADFSLYEEVEAGKLICWKLKTIPEPKFICCEMFNLDKENKKVDVDYGLMTSVECNSMLDIYEGVNVVGDELCK